MKYPDRIVLGQGNAVRFARVSSGNYPWVRIPGMKGVPEVEKKIDKNCEYRIVLERVKI